MKSRVDATYITNTLSYIHLLPLNEQFEYFYKVLHYFNANSKRNCSNTGHYKPIKKAINLINKNKNILIQFHTK